MDRTLLCLLLAGACGILHAQEGPEVATIQLRQAKVSFQGAHQGSILLAYRSRRLVYADGGATFQGPGQVEARADEGLPMAVFKDGKRYQERLPGHQPLKDFKTLDAFMTASLGRSLDQCTFEMVTLDARGNPGDFFLTLQDMIAWDR
jgi:hypothetical protein